ncbi:MAG: sulfatase-like hydrolase/transferase [Deltaproteobacteria bacterium]|nr:MAG: sulfatase-like hydrolase/transferase [Deltaproteobacteria bacterium]
MRRFSLIAALALLGCGEATLSPQRPPNLVLIIGDDHGYPDFGFMGSPYVQTPRLDRLAREGTLFTRGFTTASVCRPSLRSLLTGLHPIQWDFRVEQLRREGTRRPPLEQIRDFATLPRRLAQRGYASFQGGKYWEASYALGGFTHGMQDAGEGPHSSGSLGRTTMEPLYEFIDAHREHPFFVWFAPKLPHVPHDAGPRYRSRYENADLTTAAIAYYANITRFDDVVGQLLDYLEANGLRKSTLVVYLADNGWDQGPRAPGRKSRDGPKGKTSMHELGFRTPIIFSWPDRVGAGVVRDELVSSVDLMPTLLDYAGAEIPAELPGHSLRPVIEGTGPWTRSAVIGGMSLAAHRYSEDPTPDADPRAPALFLRSSRWRYIWYPELGRHELYDLDADSDEQHDVVEQNRVLATLFQAQIQRWQVEMTRPLVNEP